MNEQMQQAFPKAALGAFADLQGTKPDRSLSIACAPEATAQDHDFVIRHMRKQWGNDEPRFVAVTEFDDGVVRFDAWR